MVRPTNVARSRACDQCKKKRIKCDLHSPSCQRCIESNLPCSGPISGLIMVNTSSNTYTTSHARSQTRSASIYPANVGQNTNSSDLMLQKVPPTNLIFEDALLSVFLGYFSQAAANRSWDAKLPQMRSAKNAAAMKSAANAVSLAFAAQARNDISLAAAASEYYGQSLRYHQRSFVAPTGHSICQKKAVNALPVTILLSWFEMIQPTSVDAWIRHTTAAERLFLLLGPDVLSDDLLNHLYFIVKSSAVISSFITGTRTLLFGDPWSHVRMNHACGWSTDLFNDVVDLIAQLSAHFTFPLSLKFASAASDTYNDIEIHLVELSRLWTAFEDRLCIGRTKYPWTRSDLFPALLGSDFVPITEDEIPDRPPHFSDANTSLTLAFFHAATIQALTLRNPPSNMDQLSLDDVIAAISYHSAQILSCAKHLTVYGIGCTCLRMLLPIRTVYKLSRNPKQAALARSLFNRWCKDSRLPGLSDIADFDDGSSNSFPAVMPFVATTRSIAQEVEWRVELT